VAAANATISDEQDAQVKAHYRQRREAAQNSPSGPGFIPSKTSALDATTSQRQRLYQAAWDRLGFGFALAYYDILLDKAANDTAAEFIRDKIASKVHRAARGLDRGATGPAAPHREARVRGQPRGGEALGGTRQCPRGGNPLPEGPLVLHG
jgi:hypothetical protein